MREQEQFREEGEIIGIGRRETRPKIAEGKYKKECMSDPTLSHILVEKPLQPVSSS